MSLLSAKISVYRGVYLSLETEGNHLIPIHGKERIFQTRI